MGDELLVKSASLVPMLCYQWQILQDPENRELAPDEGKFRWDGKFRANANAVGDWQLIAATADVGDFDPNEKHQRVRNQIFTNISLNSNGTTNDPTWLWSGDILMDLNKYQALKMTSKSIDGKEYLFIEAGGFSTRNKPGWKPQLFVMQKK